MVGMQQMFGEHTQGQWCRDPNSLSYRLSEHSGLGENRRETPYTRLLRAFSLLTVRTYVLPILKRDFLMSCTYQSSIQQEQTLRRDSTEF